MKILLVHARYRERGGEDIAFDTECENLQKAGCTVQPLIFSNEAINVSSLLQAVQAGIATVWNESARKFVKETLLGFNPDIIHFHNTFPSVSPAVFYAVKKKAAIVQTLHNYRLLCANALLMRNGKVCEECISNGTMRALQYKCYRGSTLATMSVVAMQGIHQALGTYVKQVNKLIVLTEFAKHKFSSGGIPEEKIAVKGNTVAVDPGAGEGEGGYALFVGRLSPEKGVRTLLQAWRHMDKCPLVIAGDGILRAEAERAANESRGMIRILGRVAPNVVTDLMKKATFLIVPSECFEGFPMAIVEAYAVGTPVIAARIGALEEIVIEGETGQFFSPGNAADLIRTLSQVLSQRASLVAMRSAARQIFEDRFSPSKNTAHLLRIYEDAVGAAESERIKQAGSKRY